MVRSVQTLVHYSSHARCFVEWVVGKPGRQWFQRDLALDYLRFRRDGGAGQLNMVKNGINWLRRMAGLDALGAQANLIEGGARRVNAKECQNDIDVGRLVPEVLRWFADNPEFGVPNSHNDKDVRTKAIVLTTISLASRADDLSKMHREMTVVDAETIAVRFSDLKQDKNIAVTRSQQRIKRMPAESSAVCTLTALENWIAVSELKPTPRKDKRYMFRACVAPYSMLSAQSIANQRSRFVKERLPEYDKRFKSHMFKSAVLTYWEDRDVSEEEIRRRIGAVSMKTMRKHYLRRPAEDINHRLQSRV